MEFIDNKYTKAYYSVVEKARSQVRKKGSGVYYELHHIVPRSLGGDNTKKNLVLLTSKEHYICHLLLPKMLDGKNRVKMVYAFFRMKSDSARSYSRFRDSYAKLTAGEGNPFYGMKHTAERRQQMSGSGHPMFGRKHSEESIKRMSEVKIGKQAGELSPMWGTTHTEEWKAAHSEKMSGTNHFNFGKPAFTKGRTWMHKGTESKMVHPTDVPSFLSNGWSAGRAKPLPNP